MKIHFAVLLKLTACITEVSCLQFGHCTVLENRLEIDPVRVKYSTSLMIIDLFLHSAVQILIKLIYSSLGFL